MSNILTYSSYDNPAHTCQPCSAPY